MSVYAYVENFPSPDDQRLERQIDVHVRSELRKQEVAARVQERLALLESLGEDDYETGQVIRFTKQFTKGGTAYHYAAIKANNCWYTTDASNSRSRTWTELKLFLVSGPVPTTSYEVAPDYMWHTVPKYQKSALSDGGTLIPTKANLSLVRGGRNTVEKPILADDGEDFDSSPPI